MVGTDDDTLDFSIVCRMSRDEETPVLWIDLLQADN